ncbi:MAG: class I SAM-dependent methyltransferase [Candidatus Acidiferrales bacterium]
MTEPASSEQLREEFNRWADAGKGESMEHEHWPITRPVLERMGVAPADNILDAGCGAGWLSRILAGLANEGRVVGMDISDEMVRHARQKSGEFGNLVFVVGGVEEIPWEANFFDHAISVESSYYWPDPGKGIRELHRVLRDAGSAWILINFYRDNPYCHQWAEKLQVPVHLFSAEEWKQFFREAGFAEVIHALIPDPTPTPAEYTGRWFRNAEELRKFREIGALLIRGTKP